MHTSPAPLNVLFLCTHNSARSILAEALLNGLGAGRFRAWSAGTDPRPDGLVHALTLWVLEQAGLPSHGLRSKSVDEFAGDEAPKMDLIVTLSDSAANETCPIWPGRPATAHWGYRDPTPADTDTSPRPEPFLRLLHQMRRRIELLVSLPPEKLDQAMLQHTVRGLSRD